MNRLGKCLVLCACLALGARASEWAPIGPEIWAIKEDSAKGIKDAVVIENRTIFNNTYMERILRVRILSEAGRKAVQLPDFSEACHDFNGRTVYPDGRMVSFDKRQDFRKESTEFGYFSEKRTVVVPPGVTGNWIESPQVV